jgi:hypothetical protein
MAAVIIILAVTGTLTLAGTALLVSIIEGIRASERNRNRNTGSESITEKLAGRILGSPGARPK